MVTYAELKIGITMAGVSSSVKELKRISLAANEIQGRFSRLGLKASVLAKRFKLMTQQFSGWALSVMFFGMLIQRTFTNIAKSAVKTFKDVMEGQGAQIRGLARLEAAWTFLKFSIGNALTTALLPLLPAILDILDSLSTWINKNPELTAKIIAWGIALGGVMFLLGSVVLGMKGVLAIFANPTLIGAGLVFSGIALSFAAMSDAITSDAGALALALLGVGLATIGIGIAFSLLPAAAVGSIAAVLGVMVLFRKRLVMATQYFTLAFSNFFLNIVLKGQKAFMDLGLYILDVFDNLFRKIEAMSGGFIKLPSLESQRKTWTGMIVENMDQVGGMIKSNIDRMNELIQKKDQLGSFTQEAIDGLGIDPEKGMLGQVLDLFSGKALQQQIQDPVPMTPVGGQTMVNNVGDVTVNVENIPENMDSFMTQITDTFSAHNPGGS